MIDWGGLRISLPELGLTGGGGTSSSPQSEVSPPLATLRVPPRSTPVQAGMEISPHPQIHFLTLSFNLTLTLNYTLIFYFFMTHDMSYTTWRVVIGCNLAFRLCCKLFVRLSCA